MKELHVYSQGAWHEDAFIVGHKDELIKLKNSIQQAIDNFDDNLSKSTSEHYVSDGEGYSLHVICVNDDIINKLSLPYTETFAQASFKDPISPFELLK